jgi:hypothetical protein
LRFDHLARMICLPQHCAMKCTVTNHIDMPAPQASKRGSRHHLMRIA